MGYKYASNGVVWMRMVRTKLLVEGGGGMGDIADREDYGRKSRCRVYE